MSDRLKGKVAIVTGAGRGIGRGEALALASEGAKVVVNDLGGSVDGTGASSSPANDVVAEIKKLGGAAVANTDSVTTMKGGENIIKTALDNFGKIDILVNNAGIIRDKSFTKMTANMWTEVLTVNLDGAFYCTKAVIDGMLERKFGRIVNMSSVVGRMGNRGQANYAASKAGLIGLTQALAKEFAGKGVTVNAIAPGFVETDMLRSVPKEVMVKILAQIPLGRLGKSSEVAGAVAYLVSEDGDYITGQVIDINGGLYI